MPLRDHFHGPLSRRSYHSFHGQWAGCIQATLNRLLPRPRYECEMELHYGTVAEIDVAEFENTAFAPNGHNGANGGVAVQAAPAGTMTATMTMPLAFPEDLEIQIYDTENGKRLVGEIELVSKSNKDGPDDRQSFVAKCVAYLHKGIGLIVVDLVTDARFNLHNELVEFLGQGAPYLMAPGCWIYTAAYRPIRRSVKGKLDMWPTALAIGDPLPVVPFALLGGPMVMLNLEETYQEACDRFGIV